MQYYEVLVASQQFHGSSTLTYQYEDELPIGGVVLVPLQRQQVLGVVTTKTPKPTFIAKQIVRAFPFQLPPELIGLAYWLQGYYPAPFGQIINMLLPTTLKQFREHAEPETLKTTLPATLPPLTADQDEVIAAFLESPTRTHLLHGDTGSGKTRVYTELIRHQLATNKSVILLTPEIGLTPQLIESIEATFPGKTVVMHSNLTPAARRKHWTRIAVSKEPLIIIGPRSALFSPLKNIGLIIIDESHDSAYKQEQAPHYLTSRVAAKLAELHGGKLLSGSATPLVEDYYIFTSKNLLIHRMAKPAKTELQSGSVAIIDLAKRENFTRSAWLSNALLERIEASIKQELQSLVFLNRRGTARIVLCESCEWQATCPRCDLPLTYHGDDHRMKCHICGHHEKAVGSCPTCGSGEVRYKSIGTKALAEELTKLFPQIPVVRFDSDNPKAESLAAQYRAIKTGGAQIIIGTQMIAKGLDLPQLSTVGVVLADSALYFPDYTANEQTYQLLTQVLGRVNRGHVAGHVVIQTYHPDSETISAAINKDYDALYKRELTERQQFLYPPFVQTLKITAERASTKSADQALKRIVNHIHDTKLPVTIVGPAPAFTEKVRGKYRWHIIIKSKQRQHLLKIISELPGTVQYDLDPWSLL